MGAGLECTFERELGQFDGCRFGGVGGERSRQHQAVLGMAHPRVSFGARQLLFP